MSEEIKSKSRVIAAMVIGLVILIYQCTPQELIEPNPEVPLRPDQVQVNSLPFRVLEVDLLKAEYLYILNARNTATLEDRTLPEKTPYYYRIHVKKGKVDAVDYMEHPLLNSERCVPDEYITSLKGILQNATLCESPDVEAAAFNIPCNMHYQLPFAIIELTPTVRFHIGEKNTACDYPTRLCGEANDHLIDWVKSFIGQIKKFQCNP